MARTGPGTPSFAVQEVCVNWLISFCGSSALAGIANTRPIITMKAHRGFGTIKPRAAGRATPRNHLPARGTHFRTEVACNVELDNKKPLHPVDESLTS